MASNMNKEQHSQAEQIYSNFYLVEELVTLIGIYSSLCILHHTTLLVYNMTLWKTDMPTLCAGVLAGVGDMLPNTFMVSHAQHNYTKQYRPIQHYT